jgi:hypothetical protein
VSVWEAGYTAGADDGVRLGFLVAVLSVAAVHVLAELVGLVPWGRLWGWFRGWGPGPSEAGYYRSRHHFWWLGLAFLVIAVARLFFGTGWFR